jgi:hypothetical protein
MRKLYYVLARIGEILKSQLPGKTLGGLDPLYSW